MSETSDPDEFPNGGRRDGPAAVADYLQASYDGWRELRGDQVVHMPAFADPAGVPS